MLTTPIFTRLLTPDEYGRYNVFNSWLGIVSIVVSLNLWAGVYQQGLVKFSNEKKEFSSSLQGLTFLLVLIWTGIYVIKPHFWNEIFDLTTVQMLAMLVLVWTGAVFSFWATEQRMQYQYKLLVITTLLVSLGKPLIGMFLVKCAIDKVTARILGLVLVEVLGYAWCFVFQIKNGRQFYCAKFWKYAIKFNVPLIPHYLSQVLLNNSDRIMIKNMIGDSAAGLYSLSYSVAMIMTLFNTALIHTMTPWMYQKIKDKEINDIAPVAYLSLGIVAVVNLLLIALAPEIVRIFAPITYYESIYCIPPVVMGVFFLYSYDLFAKFAFYYEKTTLIAMASIGGAILNIILNYIGIRQFGYIAAAYTTLICYVFYACFHYILMSKICKYYLGGAKPYNTKLLILYAITFVLIGFMMLFTYKYCVIRYSIIGIIILVLIWKYQLVVNSIRQIMKVKKN